MINKYITVIALFLSLLFAAHSNASSLLLSDKKSEVIITADVGIIQGDGYLKGASGVLTIDDKSRNLESLNLAADLTDVELRSNAPQEEALLQSLLTSLDNTKVSFKSTSIKKLSSERAIVAGKIRVGENEELLSIPVQTLRLSSGDTIIKGVVERTGTLSEGVNTVISFKIRFELHFFV